MRRFALVTWLWLAFGVALAAVRLGLPSDSLTTRVLGAVAQVLVSVAIVVGVRINRPERRLPWYLLAANTLCTCVASIVVSVSTRDGVVPFPSWADAWFLLAYPFQIAGLLLLVRGLSWRRDRAGLLDALTISACLGLTMWLLFMRPLVDDTTMVPFARLVSVAYPVADLLLISVLIRFFTSPGLRIVSFWLLSASLLLLTGTDMLWLIGTSFGGYDLEVDPYYTVSTFCLAAAALHPSMATFTGAHARPPARLSAARVLFIGSACLLAPALLFPQGLMWHGRVDWIATGIGCIVLFTLALVRMLGLVQQVQEQASRLDVIAHVDALTAMPNRRAWDLELARLVENAARHHEPIVVALLDLDNFKRYNDQYGHPEGDALLRDAAAAWRAQLRVGDLLARYGGEEFGVVLIRARLSDSEGVMDRLRAATPKGQTFSAGLAQWDGAETPVELVARADEALYSAKRAGRNRWHVIGARPAQHPAGVS